jgi:flagellar basal-body rod protein FlgB
MDLSQIGLFNGIVGKMNWLIQRQGVIAQNVENVDTPGYEAQDVTPFSFKTMMKKVAPVATDPNHIQPVGDDDSNGEGKAASALRTTWELKPDGNAVSSEREMKKAADTATDYQLVSNIYKHSIGLIKTALGESGT